MKPSLRTPHPWAKSHNAALAEASGRFTLRRPRARTKPRGALPNSVLGTYRVERELDAIGHAPAGA
jgi:hypothetical protein